MFLSPCNAERAGAQREQPADARDDRPQRADRMHHRQGRLQSCWDQVCFHPCYDGRSTRPLFKTESDVHFVPTTKYVQTFSILLHCIVFPLQYGQEASFQIEISQKFHLTFGRWEWWSACPTFVFVFHHRNFHISNTAVRFDPFQQILHRQLSEGKLYISQFLWFLHHIHIMRQFYLFIQGTWEFQFWPHPTKYSPNISQIFRQLSGAMIRISNCEDRDAPANLDRTISITGNTESVALAQYLINMR